MNAIAWIAIAVAVGAIIACIAHTRGRSFSRWWVYGSLLGVIALPHLLLARDLSSDRRWSPVRFGLPTRDRTCPFCGMPVREAALVCRHCRQAVDPDIRRNGWQPRGEPVGSRHFDGPSQYPAPASATAGMSVVGAEWSMAGFTGVSPVPANADTTPMRFRRRSSASPSPRAPAAERAADAGEPPPESAPQTGESEAAAAGAAGSARPDRTPEHSDAAEAFVRQPGPGVSGSPDRADRARRQRRDSGMLPRPVAAAAIAVCVVATLFVTGAWRYGADIARLIAPASSGERQMSGDYPNEASPEPSLPADPAPPAGRMAGPERSSDESPGSTTEPVGTPPLPPGAPPPRDLAATGAPTPPPAVADADEPTPPSSPRLDPPPEPAPAIDSTSLREADGRARYNAATPKVPPMPRQNAATPKVPPRRGFDAAEQASFDKVVERLEREMAAARASASQRTVDREAAISATGDVVYELQLKLKAKGFDPGGVDGQFGPQTRRALKAYQRDVGMPPTGNIDKDVLIAFGLIS